MKDNSTLELISDFYKFRVAIQSSGGLTAEDWDISPYEDYDEEKASHLTTTALLHQNYCAQMFHIAAELATRAADGDLQAKAWMKQSIITMSGIFSFHPNSYSLTFFPPTPLRSPQIQEDIIQREIVLEEILDKPLNNEEERKSENEVACRGSAGEEKSENKARLAEEGVACRLM